MFWFCEFRGSCHRGADPGLGARDRSGGASASVGVGRECPSPELPFSLSLSKGVRQQLAAAGSSMAPILGALGPGGTPVPLLMCSKTWSISTWASSICPFLSPFSRSPSRPPVRSDLFFSVTDSARGFDLLSRNVQRKDIPNLSKQPHIPSEKTTLRPWYGQASCDTHRLDFSKFSMAAGKPRTQHCRNLLDALLQKARRHSIGRSGSRSGHNSLRRSGSFFCINDSFFQQFF